jgi:HK97 family phage prohead protease
MTKTALRAPAVMESRTGILRDVELRKDANGAAIGFAGHAAVFDYRTSIGNPLSWGFYEQIAPGAFTKTIKEADVRFLIDHDPSLLLARTKSGTLRLSEDLVGLAADADLAPTTYGRDLAVLLERGDVSQMSFGFQVVKDDWTKEQVETNGDPVDVEVRTIREAKLFDVSVVTFPAYEGTDATLRSMTAAVSRKKDPDPFGRRRKMLTRALSLSDGNVALLQQILTSLAAADAAVDPITTALSLADEAMDEAQTGLAQVLGVEDPDAEDDDETEVESASGVAVADRDTRASKADMKHIQSAHDGMAAMGASCTSQSSARSKREPAEATPVPEVSEPVVSTHSIPVSRRMKAYQARFGLPAA